MVNKKIVYGLVILSLLRAFSLDAAAHYTPPAGFEGLAPEYAHEPKKELVDEFTNQEDISSPRGGMKDWGYDNIVNGLSYFLKLPYENLMARGVISPENKEKARAAFDALLHFAIISHNSYGTPRVVIDISKTPFFKYRLDDRNETTIDVRLDIYLKMFPMLSVEGRWFTKLYLDWLVKNKGIDSPAVADFRRRYIEWITNRDNPDMSAMMAAPEKPREFIDSLLASYPKTPVSLPQQQIPSIGSAALVTTRMRAAEQPKTTGIIRPPTKSVAAASAYKTPAGFEGLAPEYAQVPNKKLVEEFTNSWTLNFPRGGFHEFGLDTITRALVAFLRGESSSLDLNNRESIRSFSAEDKEKVGAAFEGLLNFKKVNPYNEVVLDISKTPFFGTAYEQRLVTTLDARLQLYLTMFPMLSPEGKWFTKLYLDWLVKNTGINSPEIGNFKHRYMEWIQKDLNPDYGSIDVQAATKFIDGLLASYKKQSLTPSTAAALATRRTRETSAARPAGSTPRVTPPTRSTLTPTSAQARTALARTSARPTIPAPLPKPSALPTSARTAPKVTSAARPATAPTRVTPPARSSASAPKAAVPSRAPAQARTSLSTARQAAAPVQQAPLPSRPSALPTPSRAAPRQITRPTIAQPATPRVPTRVTPPARSLAPVMQAVSSRAPTQARPPLSRPAAAPTQPAPRSTSIRVTPPAARPAATRPLATATQTRRPAAAPAVPSSRPTPRATTQPAPRLTPTRSTSAARPAAVLRPSAVPPRSTAVMQRQQAAQEKARLAAQAKAAARTQSTRPPVRPGYRR